MDICANSREMKMLDEAPSPKRDLVTPTEFDGLITAARSACEKNGEQLADYLRFLAFSGRAKRKLYASNGPTWTSSVNASQSVSTA